MRAKPPGRVDISPGSFQVDLNVETVFAAPEAVTLRRTEIYFVHARSDHNSPGIRDDITAFADFDFGFALTITVEAQAHFPGSDSRSFDDRIRGHIQVFNSQAIATATGVTAAVVGSGSVRHHIHQENIEKSGQQSCFYPIHGMPPFIPSCLLRRWRLSLATIQLRKDKNLGFPYAHKLAITRPTSYRLDGYSAAALS
jgi:hypothetical protein